MGVSGVGDSMRGVAVGSRGIATDSAMGSAGRGAEGGGSVGGGGGGAKTSGGTATSVAPLTDFEIRVGVAISLSFFFLASSSSTLNLTDETTFGVLTFSLFRSDFSDSFKSFCVRSSNAADAFETLLAEVEVGNASLGVLFFRRSRFPSPPERNFREALAEELAEELDDLGEEVEAGEVGTRVDSQDFFEKSDLATAGLGAGAEVGSLIGVIGVRTGSMVGGASAF